METVPPQTADAIWIYAQRVRRPVSRRIRDRSVEHGLRVEYDDLDVRVGSLEVIDAGDEKAVPHVVGGR